MPAKATVDHSAEEPAAEFVRDTAVGIVPPAEPSGEGESAAAPAGVEAAAEVVEGGRPAAAAFEEHVADFGES